MSPQKLINVRAQDEIFSSAYASVVYLTKVLSFPADKKVYVVGESGIEDELRSENVQICGGTVRSSLLSTRLE